MKPQFYMYHFILLVALAASGGCWPIFEDENKVVLKTARDSQPVGSSTTSSSAITIQTNTLSKEINTALAGLILILVVGTYWLLMRYTKTLSSEIILPADFLEDNIAVLLSGAWLKHFTGPPTVSIDEHDLGHPWLLFYMSDVHMRKSEETPILACSPEGSHDVGGRSFTHSYGKGSMAGFKIFSPVMKGLVHVAIWNSISFWLVLAMVVNTLVYNGFASNNITNDSIVRLLLVSVFAVTNIGHQFYITTLLYHNFTIVLFQACWTMICKKFVFLNTDDYKAKVMRRTNFVWTYKDHLDVTASDMVWTSFNLELFGTTERSRTYRLSKDGDQLGYVLGYEAVMSSIPDYQKARSYLIAQDKAESTLDKFVKPLREAEIKAYEKAIDSALEKTLANVAVLLSICLATALAPWTSVQTFNATNAQLGSYALLLSISTGILALVSSMTQATNATESAKLLLLLQEKTIQASNFMHETEEVSNYFSVGGTKPSHSFSAGMYISAGIHSQSPPKRQSPLKWFEIWKSTSLLGKLPYLLFGSALMLIPRGDRTARNGSTIYFEVKDDHFKSSVSTESTGGILRNSEQSQERECCTDNNRSADVKGVVDEEEAVEAIT